MKPCIICGAPCSSALDPTDHRRRGKRQPLCDGCFNDTPRLLHAMAFARAVWR
jgi:hypothetical protein